VLGTWVPVAAGLRAILRAIARRTRGENGDEQGKGHETEDGEDAEEGIHWRSFRLQNEATRGRHGVAEVRDVALPTQCARNASQVATTPPAVNTAAAGSITGVGRRRAALIERSPARYPPRESAPYLLSPRR
jgi:hypothetical protein